MKINKPLKWILIIGVALLLIGWLVIPILVKNYAIKNSKELLGRQIDIERLRLNFFTGNIHVNGFEMYEQDDQTVFVSFDTLNVNIEPYQFLFNKKVVEQFYLQGLYVNIIKRDTTYNFDDLVAFHMAEEETPQEDPEEEEAFKYILSNLELKDARFVFDNRDVEHVTQIDDFSFFIPQISWDQAEKSNADIKFNFRKEGYLEASMNVNPVDGSYDASVQVYHLYLDPFLQYFQEYAEISDIQGTLNTQLVLNGNINEVEKSLLTGRMVLENFSMKDLESKEFLKAEKASCRFQEIDAFNESYHMDSLIIDRPYLFFQLDSASNNIYRIFKLDSLFAEEEKNEQQQDSIEETPMFYAINYLGLNEGIMDYTDNLTGQPFEYHLSEIQIRTDSIFSDSEWIEINAQMLLNERGTLLAQVGYDPKGLQDGELHISVEKFLLPDLNIYTNHYMGHTMVEGDMFYYSDSKVVSGNIESENRLIIKQPEVTNSEGGLYTLPLKLALWLLSDKNGDVNLNVPVRGDLNDPEIDVWQIVWNTFRNKIKDTAEDPVTSLAPLVNADPKDLRSIDFNFTDTIASEQNQKQLNWLLELEKVKEGLSIELEYRVDEDLQKEALAEIHKADTQKGPSPADSLSGQPESLIDLDSLSKKYSNARLGSIRRYLDSVSSGTHIQTVATDSLAPQNTGVSPSFLIKFQMQTQMDSLKPAP